MKRLSLLPVLAILLLFPACKKEPAKVVSISPSEFSSADQLKIGDAFKNEIAQSQPRFEILDKSAYAPAYSYLEKLFGTMINTAQVEHRLVFDWTVDIIRDDSVKTLFFLPGGHLYIYTGLLKFVDTESQLLGLIGHEIYYADTDLLIYKMRDQFEGKILGDILLENNVPQLGDLAAAMPSLAFEEEDVLAADSFAVAMICPFLYEPLGIRSFVEKAEMEAIAPEWLRARPASPGPRYDNLERHALPCGLNGVTNETAYQKFKQEYLPK